jgi:hypothetical protein
MKKRIGSGCRYLSTASLLLSLVLFLVLAQTSGTVSLRKRVMDPQPTGSVAAKVLRVSLVCRDIEATSKLWAEVFDLPVPKITTTKTGSQSYFMDFHSAAPNAEFKRVLLQLENTQIEFLQPIGIVASPEAEFVKKYPAGIRRVLVAVRDATAAERFKKLGLAQRTQGGRDLYMDSVDKLGVATEWIVVKDQEALDAITATTDSQSRNLSEAPSGGLRSILQVCLVAKDMKAMSQNWAEVLGVRPPEIPTRESSWMFDGVPTNAKLKAVFLPLGDNHYVIEVVGLGSGDGSNLFSEFLRKRGDGVDHLAFGVNDMDVAVKHFQHFGLNVGMVPPPRPDVDASQSVHVMETLEKLGTDVELFYRAACCAPRWGEHGQAWRKAITQ